MFLRQNTSGNLPHNYYVEKAKDFRPIEWEVWHTYSTYLDGLETDLLGAAKSFVASEVAECVVSNTGEAFWRDGDKVIRASLSISRDVEEGRVTFLQGSRLRL